MNKTEMVLVILLVMSFVFSGVVMAYATSISDNLDTYKKTMDEYTTTNTYLWDRQLKINQDNLDLWEQQLEIDQAIADVLGLLV
jgi:Tfp pilus assembly protein PilO